MKKLLLLIASLVVNFTLSAQILSQWSLTSTTTSATTSEANVTNSSISLSSGTIQYTASPSSIFASSWPTSTSFSTSGKFWEFSITSNSGKSMLLSSVTFEAGRTASGPPSIQVQYSFDGFSTAGINAGTFTTSNTTTLDAFSLTNLPSSSLTGTVTFRIWGYGASSTGNFRINNITINGATSTLPISLISFTPTAVDQTILLNWQTASEKDNDYFEVLRSADGKNFATISHQIKGAGTSNNTNSYSFTDENPYAGTNYYKLAQHDFDGKISYSEIKSVTSKVAQAQLAVYATPSDIKISIFSPNQTTGTVEVFDISGRKLASNTAAISKGYNQLSIPINLQPGAHFVRYTSEGKNINVKFLK
ncbi:T9SS type A sorting domain-containing protein [Pelobium sp.]|nr:T9SS type A sorting domain-containing protein [Pelobium sp.]MDA9554780.1 T9SS type A sorting domain-containing protein [Pelobium sp.]